MSSFVINTELDHVETRITMDWEPPIPFAIATQEETIYPLQALPTILQKTVFDYQQYGQQPISLIACGALANVSLACQSLANVARDHYLISPVSLYFIVLASSGVLFFATLFLKNCPKIILYTPVIQY